MRPGADGRTTHTTAEAETPQRPSPHPDADDNSGPKDGMLSGSGPRGSPSWLFKPSREPKDSCLQSLGGPTRQCR